MKVPACRIMKGADCAVRIGKCRWQRCYTIRIRPAKGKELINPGLLNMLEARAQPWSCSRMPCQLPPARPFSAERGTEMLTETAASLLPHGLGEPRPGTAGPGCCDTVGSVLQCLCPWGVQWHLSAFVHPQAPNDTAPLRGPWGPGLPVGNGSLFQVFSASKDFQPTDVTVLGFTGSTHSRDWVQTSPQGVSQHPKCSNTKRLSPALTVYLYR